ncbi:hypothetical protein ACFQ7W_23060 [Streptomyces niveus]|uniref:hypothetical protein n=1 Tax=Streptomyces niveus TaxID=193462 RepID=UPI0036BEC799
MNLGISPATFLAGRASSDADPVSIAICGILFIVGIVLVFDWKGAAERFYRLTSTVTFGFVGFATTRTLRFGGAVVALLGLIGVIVEIVVEISWQSDSH